MLLRKYSTDWRTTPFAARPSERGGQHTLCPSLALSSSMRWWCEGYCLSKELTGQRVLLLVNGLTVDLSISRNPPVNLQSDLFAIKYAGVDKKSSWRACTLNYLACERFACCCLHLLLLLLLLLLSQDQLLPCFSPLNYFNYVSLCVQVHKIVSPTPSRGGTMSKSALSAVHLIRTWAVIPGSRIRRMFTIWCMFGGGCAWRSSRRMSLRIPNLNWNPLHPLSDALSTIHLLWLQVFTHHGQDDDALAIKPDLFFYFYLLVFCPFGGIK